MFLGLGKFSRQIAVGLHLIFQDKIYNFQLVVFLDENYL